jgi:ABC-type antimicrobial peptide transport system permease subunit
LVLGFVLGLFWVTVQFPAILGWRLDLHLPYGFAAGAAALTIGLCIVASLLPSARASRLAVAQALRNE